MEKRRYINAGEGYWYDSKNPSRGVSGLPPEIQEQREKKYNESLYLELAEEIAIKSKAEKLLEKYSGLVSREEKIKFLEEIMKYRKIKVEGGYSEFENAEKKFIDRMYKKVIRGLQSITENPRKYKNSKLVDRIYWLKTI